MEQTSVMEQGGELDSQIPARVRFGTIFGLQSRIEWEELTGREEEIDGIICLLGVPAETWASAS